MSETFEIDELNGHPKSMEAYGEPEVGEDMIDDVGENGIRNNPKVTKDSHFADGVVVIGGHRRIQAAFECDIELVECDVETYRTPAEEIEAVRQDNNYRDKVFSDRMGEYDLIKEVEEKKAKQRKRATQNNESAEQFERTGQEGQTRDVIAEKIGIGSGTTLTRGVKIWEYAHGREDHENIPPQLAECMVNRIDGEQESITGSYNTLRDLEKEAEEPDEPEPEESEEPEQEESDEPEQEQDEPEESEGSSEDERIEAVLSDLYDVETEGEKGFVDGILGYIDAYDLTADDVESAREDRDPDSEESFMNQLHIRAGNVNRIHSGPEYDEIHGSDESEEEQEGNEEQNRGTSESTESGSDDEPEWSDSVSSSDGEDTSPEDSVEEAETDSSDESEESQGESDTEYTPVVQERSMDSTEDSDEELPDTMDPVDILNQPTDEKVRQKAKEAGYETPDDLVEDMYNIEFGSDGKSQTMREAMGEEAFQDFVEFKMDTQQVHREWNEDPLISKVQSHYKSFRNLRDVFERTPDDMSCPCCGSGTTKLEWSCCGVELGESLERHAEEAEENKSEALERMGQIEDEVRNGVEVESEVNEE